MRRAKSHVSSGGLNKTLCSCGKSVAGASNYMAKPDTPNFSIGGRIVFGAIALIVIISLLRLFGVF
jgi:hypothetical protein